MPYPGPLLGKGLKNRIAITARLRSFGRPDKKAYRVAAQVAKKDALKYAEQNCTKYFDFQASWPSMMNDIDCDKVISSQILTAASEIPEISVDAGQTTEIQVNVG